MSEFIACLVIGALIALAVDMASTISARAASPSPTTNVSIRLVVALVAVLTSLTIMVVAVLVSH